MELVFKCHLHLHLTHLLMVDTLLLNNNNHHHNIISFLLLLLQLQQQCLHLIQHQETLQEMFQE